MKRPEGLFSKGVSTEKKSHFCCWAALGYLLLNDEEKTRDWIGKAKEFNSDLRIVSLATPQTLEFSGFALPTSHLGRKQTDPDQTDQHRRGRPFRHQKSFSLPVHASESLSWRFGHLWQTAFFVEDCGG